MSDLLKQALVDGAQLREAAQKAAEKAILEQYSEQFKEALHGIMEQELGDDEEEEPGLEADLGAEQPLEDMDPMGGLPEAEPQIMQNIPHAASAGEKMCQCPDEEEEIEIDLGDLMQTVDSEQEMGRFGEEEMGIHDEFAEEIPGSDPLREDHGSDYPGARELPYDFHQPGEEDEDYQYINDLLERVVFDSEPVKNGLTTDNDPNIDYQYDVMRAKEAHQDDEQDDDDNLDEYVEKHSEQLYESVQKIFENQHNQQIKLLEEQIENLKNQNQKYKIAISNIQEKFNDVNLLNAKYSKIISIHENDSLNGKQKQIVSENIFKAKRYEDIELIVETIKSTVSKKQSKTRAFSGLNKVLSEHRMAPLSVQGNKRQEQKEENPFVQRMQKLAGIKKKISRR